MWKVFFILLKILLIHICILKTENAIYRLPKSIKPISYQVELNLLGEIPNGEKIYFNGSVIIKIKITQPTNTIYMHSKNLEVKIPETSPNLPLLAKKCLHSSTNITYDSTYEYLIFNLQRKVDFTCYIYLEFSGNLKTKDHFFGNFIIGSASDFSYYIASNFKPIQTRMLFPCFDEPQLRASFQISFSVEDIYTVLVNNAATISQLKDNNRTTYAFERIEHISPYMLNIVIFETTEWTEVFENKSSIWIRRSISDTNAENSLILFANCVQIMESRTISTLLNMEKISLITFPNFRTMASTPGLVTLSETKTINFPENEINLVKDFQYVNIAVHVAQMYFGSILSVKWWNEAWMDIGLSTYLGYHILNQENKKNRFNEKFVINVRQTIMQRELKDSRVLDQNVETPEEINDISYDDIAKSKGASLFYMMEYFIGSHYFHKALSIYLDKNKYSSVGSSDFFAAVRNVMKNDTKHLDGYDIETIMESWKQPFYPIVSVTFDRQKKLLQFSQTSILSINKDDSSSWIIPINYITNIHGNINNALPMFWLNGTIQKKFYDDWLIVNKDQTAYYRVLYDKTLWSKITKHLVKSPFLRPTSWYLPLLTPLTKSQLLDDSFALAEVGVIEFAYHFDLANFLIKETDFIPWMTSVRNFESLSKKIGTTPTYPSFREYVNALLNGEVLNKIFDLNIDDENVGILKYIITNALTRYRDANWILRAETILNNITIANSTNPIDINIRSSVYCAAVVENEMLWHFLKNSLDYSENISERRRLISALACTNSVDLLDMYYQQFYLNQNDISTKANAVTSLLSNIPTGINFIFNKMINSFNDFQKDVPLNVLTEFLNEIANNLGTNEQQTQLQTLTKNNKIFAGALLNANKIVSNNVKWNNIFLEQIDQWLRNEIIRHSTTTASTTTTGGHPTKSPNFAFKIQFKISYMLIFTIVYFCCDYNYHLS